MTRRRKVLLASLLGLAAMGAFGAVCNWTVDAASAGRVYSSVNQVPYNRVAVVLGTAPTVDGQPNPYFTGRIAAAAELYKAGKAQRLLVSGTNDRPDYNEPAAMKAALIARGVPESAIVEDFAGLRTLDTVVRAKKVFGISQCIFVTDDFHMSRTLWLAENNGVQAVGFTSRVLPVSVSPKTHLREIAARVLVVLDVEVFHRGPKFLGRPEAI